MTERVGPGEIRQANMASAIEGSLRATRCEFSSAYAPRNDNGRDDSCIKRIDVHEIPDVKATADLLAAIPVTLRFDRGRVFFDA